MIEDEGNAGVFHQFDELQNFASIQNKEDFRLFFFERMASIK
jgi:hypothetical protein